MTMRIKAIVAIIVVVLFSVAFSNERYSVKETDVYLRSKPKSNSGILGTFQQGTILNVIERTNVFEFINGIYAEWYKIGTIKGTEGYIFSGFLSKCEGTYDRIEKYISDSKHIIVFDTAKISRSEIERLYDFHPDIIDNLYLHYYWLELCISSDTGYYPCGSRDINDTNFFKNAEYNIRRFKKSIEGYDSSGCPHELEDMLDMILESKRFYLWLETTRYNYLTTWNIDTLKNIYRGISPMDICPESIRKIDQSTSKIEKYKLSRFEWHNALNRYYRENIYDDELVKDIWKKFLEKKGIKDEIQDEGDGD